jgi:hypothetical protein
MKNGMIASPEKICKVIPVQIYFTACGKFSKLGRIST